MKKIIESWNRISLIKKIICGLAVGRNPRAGCSAAERNLSAGGPVRRRIESHRSAAGTFSGHERARQPTGR